MEIFCSTLSHLRKIFLMALPIIFPSLPPFFRITCMGVVRMRPIQRAKQLLRKQIELTLYEIPDSEKRIQSSSIHRKLFEMPIFVKSRRVSCYISNDILVQTDAIIRRIFADKKTFFVPRFNVEHENMNLLLVNSLSDYTYLPMSKYNGMRQPKYTDLRQEASKSGGLDLIIMPGLGFTPKGKRLGFGDGFYDTYLKEFKRRILRPTLIGLAFKQQIFPYLPSNLHDICVDIVIWPT